MVKKEKQERSFFWKGLVMGLLTGIMGNLFVSYMMKAFEFVQLPPAAWIVASIVALGFVMCLVWLMWRKSEE